MVTTIKKEKEVVAVEMTVTMMMEIRPLFRAVRRKQQ